MASQGPKDAAKEYLDYSTAHGLSRVKNTPLIILKVLWCLAIVAAIVIVGIQISRLYADWKAQPINTNIAIMTEKEIRFPAVTLCNSNPVLFSKIVENDIRELLQVVVAVGDIHGIDGTFYGLQNYSVADFEDIENLTYANDFLSEMVDLFNLRLSALSTAVLTNISQPIEDLIVSCYFAGELCDDLAFLTRLEYGYGTCYTFGVHTNSSYDEDDFKIGSPGKEYGLELILNVNQNDYVPYMTPTAGVVVAVHGADDWPAMEVDGIIVPTGVATNIAVVKEVEKRIPGSTDRCSDDPFVYSIEQCQKDCFEYLIEIYCGCTRLANLFWNSDEAQSYGEDRGLQSCKTVNDSHCIYELRDGIRGGNLQCSDCKAPCSRTIYATTVSSARWPALKYEQVLEKQIERFNQNVSSTLTFNDASVRDNLVRLQVYLASFNVMTMEEESAYSDENFVSDIGGQLGLWVGFSVLSLCELIELLVLVINACRHRKLAPKEADDVTEDKGDPDNLKQLHSHH